MVPNTNRWSHSKMQHSLASIMPIKAYVYHYPCDDSTAESLNKFDATYKMFTWPKKATEA
jgi:hypothetical protein